MKAKLDKAITGKIQIAGLKTQIKGRIWGSNRSRKIVKIWGKLGLQDRLRRVRYVSTAINTRYGTLGVKTTIAYRKIRK